MKLSYFLFFFAFGSLPVDAFQSPADGRVLRWSPPQGCRKRVVVTTSKTQAYEIQTLSSKRETTWRRISEFTVQTRSRGDRLSLEVVAEKVAVEPPQELGLSKAEASRVATDKISGTRWEFAVESTGKAKLLGTRDKAGKTVLVPAFNPMNPLAIEFTRETIQIGAEWIAALDHRIFGSEQFVSVPLGLEKVKRLKIRLAEVTEKEAVLTMSGDAKWDVHEQFVMAPEKVGDPGPVVGKGRVTLSGRYRVDLRTGLLRSGSISIAKVEEQRKMMGERKPFVAGTVIKALKKLDKSKHKLRTIVTSDTITMNLRVSEL